MRIPAGLAKRLSRGAEPAPGRDERQREGLLPRQGLQAEPVTPRILAIDTTSEFGSLALVARRRAGRGRCSCSRAEGFGHILFPAMEALLADERLEARRHRLLRRGGRAGFVHRASAWAWPRSRAWPKRSASRWWRSRTSRPSPGIRLRAAARGGSRRAARRDLRRACTRPRWKW